MALILSRAAIQRCLDMRGAIEAARIAFLALHAGEVRMPQRSLVELSASGLALLMPSVLAVPEHPAFGLKMLTTFPSNAQQGLPRSAATVLLVNAANGQTQAILEGSWLTAVRTGAVSGLATDLLARRDANVLALFGAGAQAPMQVWAIHTVRPLREVRVVNHDESHYQQLVDTLHHLLGEDCPFIRRVANSHEALDGALLVACATAATSPLFSDQNILPGTHINAIGAFTPAMCEVDAHTLARARIVVDQREAALVEAGDLLQALAQGQIGGADSWLELGELLNDQQRGRQHPDEITCFKSVGLGIQDLLTARYVYERAREMGVGIEVEI